MLIELSAATDDVHQLTTVVPDVKCFETNTSTSAKCKTPGFHSETGAEAVRIFKTDGKSLLGFAKRAEIAKSFANGLPVLSLILPNLPIERVIPSVEIFVILQNFGKVFSVVLPLCNCLKLLRPQSLLRRSPRLL